MRRKKKTCEKKKRKKGQTRQKITEGMSVNSLLRVKTDFELKKKKRHGQVEKKIVLSSRLTRSTRAHKAGR